VIWDCPLWQEGDNPCTIPEVQLQCSDIPKNADDWVHTACWLGQCPIGYGASWYRCINYAVKPVSGCRPIFLDPATLTLK